MKRLLIVILGISLCALVPCRAHAQAQELEQLALDIEKLAQMKSILQEMYKGYQILTGGYNAIKSLAKGNFDLHASYLNGLLVVSPTVKKYVRVTQIISMQTSLVAQYKKALKGWTGSKTFSAAEIAYFSEVYAHLFTRSLDNLDQLAMILTDNRLRASDAERLAGIDQIYTDMQDKLAFLQTFDGKAAVLATQRQRDQQQLNFLQSLIGH